MTINLVVFVHGIEEGNQSFQPIKDCMETINKAIPVGSFAPFFFNWDKIVTYRQEDAYNACSYRGNPLTRIIRKHICNLGLDMWMYLNSKKGNASGDWYNDIHKELRFSIDTIQDVYDKKGMVTELSFVAHSWGTKIALDYIINNPDKKVKYFITLGSPLAIYGSACYDDWGDPDLIKNIEKWINISFPNDPISNLFKDIPNHKWKEKVEDIEFSQWFKWLPLQSHTAYFTNDKVIQKIIETLKS